MTGVERLESRTLLSGVVGRHVFYNHSAFDGRAVRADPRDDNAVAPTVAALLPGQPPSPANITSYPRGINGVMVDLADLPPGAAITAADFAFRVGNSGQPSLWQPAPAPRSVTTRPSPDGGATRVTIVWRDRSIRNAWLEVTALASAATGLAAPDVFYLGNLAGDAAADGGPVERITVADIDAPAANLTRSATVDNPNDVDRNGRVNRADARAPRRNLGAELYAAGPFGGTVDSAPAPPLPGLWNLVFRDEFSADALDPVWHPAQYWDHNFTVVGGGELQAYDRSGLSLSDGLLHLTARREDTHGVPYTSGLVMTGGEQALPTSPRFSFLYGYLEVRAKLPAGKGLWPAVWMMPASFHDNVGELDVVEVFGGDPTRATFTTHRGDRQDVHDDWTGPDLSKDFHTFGVEWAADHIAWFVDGVEVARTTGTQWVVHEAMYPIIDLAVGGTGNPQPDETTPFPATMDVDYVRVWQGG
jgi:hypothetical protein